MTNNTRAGRVHRLRKIIVGVLLLVPGCAGLPLQIEFSTPVPSKLQLPGITHIAILDFATPLGSAEHGRWFAEELTRRMQEKTLYQPMEPSAARLFMSQHRLLPSRFRERTVIRAAGKALAAEALLFGDLPMVRLEQQTQTDMLQRKVGEEVYREILIDATGTSRTVLHTVPVYKNIPRHTIQRHVQMSVDARIVRVADGAVLWEGGQTFRKDYHAIEVEGEERTGEWRPDQDLIHEGLKSMGSALLSDFYPHQVKRIRILARLSSHDTPTYAQSVNQGNRLAMNGHWEEAGNWWLRAAGLTPDPSEARANLGILREQAGELTQALEDYRFAAERLGSPWDRYAKEVENQLAAVK